MSNILTLKGNEVKSLKCPDFVLTTHSRKMMKVHKCNLLNKSKE